MAGKVNLPEIPWFEAGFDEEDFRQWYSENPEACSEYLREKKNEYETIRRGLRFQEPHPIHYEFGVDDPRYASDLRVWENAVAMDTVLKAHKPPPQPQPLSPGMKVLLHGNEEDKNEFRERMSLVKAALEARESEDHERRLGNVTKAADYASRAGAFEREIKKREKNIEFSFQAEEKKPLRAFSTTNCRAPVAEGTHLGQP